MSCAEIRFAREYAGAQSVDVAERRSQDGTSPRPAVDAANDALRSLGTALVALGRLAAPFVGSCDRAADVRGREYLRGKVAS